ncbi:MAG TPA: four helix bundle protein [Bryobacteraceae bacterium]|nr:four helix bundle protein [Bryobacteraceae bacterium]
MKDFHDLKVWSKAHALTLAIYAATASFPRSERFGLTDQMRRACTSIATNIAEGCGREGEAELRHFLSIARGSASELEYHLLLARDLNYLTPTDHERLSNEITQIKRMLTVFIQKLKADS